MANFLKFKGKRFTERTASAGTKFKPYYQGVPKLLKTGAQSKVQGGFFDYTRVRAAPEKYHVEVDEETNEKQVSIERVEYKTKIENFIDENFTTAVATNLKSKFNSSMGTAVDALPPGEFVSMLVPPSRSHPTASMKFKRMPGILNPGYLVIQNDSTDYEFAHFSLGNIYSPLQFGEAGGIPGQQGQHRFASGITTSADYGVRASGSEAISKGLTGSYLMTTGSDFNGSVAGLTNYNGVNNNDGAYYGGAVKGNVSGEDILSIGITDITDLIYVPNTAYYYYTSSQAVQNGVFKYNSSSAQAAKTSGCKPHFPLLTCIWFHNHCQDHESLLTDNNKGAHDG